MDKESPEERLKKVEIKPVERECLDRVFKKLGMYINIYWCIDWVCVVHLSTDKPKEFKDKISASDLIKVLQKLDPS